MTSLAFSILATRQPEYLIKLFTLWSDKAASRRLPRYVPAKLTYDTPRFETLRNGFIITATDVINSLSKYQIEFDVASLSRFKSLLRGKLILEEVQNWRQRVSRDSSLILNPLPQDPRLSELLCD